MKSDKTQKYYISQKNKRFGYFYCNIKLQHLARHTAVRARIKPLGMKIFEVLIILYISLNRKMTYGEIEI